MGPDGWKSGQRARHERASVMSVVTIFSASFRNGESVAEMLAERLGCYRLPMDVLASTMKSAYRKAGSVRDTEEGLEESQE